MNTSGLSTEIVHYHHNQSEVDAANAAHVAECDRLKAEALDPDKIQLPAFVSPPRRKGLAGGGSLTAGGFEVSKPHNRDSLTAVEPELEGILAWLFAEFAFDAAVPAKLRYGTTWDRPVMNSAKAFTMYRPFFSFCAGGHLYELLKRLMKDVIGLRQRLTVKYTQTLFWDIGDIRKACKLLPLEVDHKTATFLVSLTYPLLVRSLEKDTAVVAAEHTPAVSSLGSVFKLSDDMEQRTTSASQTAKRASLSTWTQIGRPIKLPQGWKGKAVNRLRWIDSSRRSVQQFDRGISASE